MRQLKATLGYTAAADDVDIDGDGRVDVTVTFDSSPVPPTPLKVSVTPLRRGLPALQDVANDSYSRLIARVGEAIIVRIPLEPR